MKLATLTRAIMVAEIYDLCAICWALFVALNSIQFCNTRIRPLFK